ncbi:hypothetical protein ACE41A_08745 [Bacillus cytotoxicus]|uniref:hypothetical protein n=1 Tax=Bacillus cereus group TaxID=86661 RepID=UPI001F56A3ED|nr:MULTISPECIES: hypothetical protein [unclassified Bacillus cereus group]
MGVYNVTFTKMKVYESVVEAETMEEILQNVCDFQLSEDDLVKTDIVINNVKEVGIKKEQKFG